MQLFVMLSLKFITKYSFAAKLLQLEYSVLIFAENKLSYNGAVPFDAMLCKGVTSVFYFFIP